MWKGAYDMLTQGGIRPSRPHGTDFPRLALVYLIRRTDRGTRTTIQPVGVQRCSKRHLDWILAIEMGNVMIALGFEIILT
jgi:hypothetical protein